ncbi:hypothetical protein ACR77J_07260 [Tissierella praeacuta]|uniref:hypothetical protein n=1 Tax=Tissierella praeacuta TaxID=43131 RepID=UPI003DA46092
MLSIYDDTILSYLDRRKIIKLKQSYEMYDDYDAHHKAERIRAKYGYSGGADGSKYIRLCSGKCKFCL